MTESATIFLVDKLSSFVMQKGENLSTGIRKELERIKSELEHLLPTIKDINEGSSPEHSIWMKQVTEVTYEIEDILDELSHQLAENNSSILHNLLSTIFYYLKNKKIIHQLSLKADDIRSIRATSEGYRSFEDKARSSKDRKKGLYDRRDALLLHQSDLVGTAKPKKELIELLSKEYYPDLKVIPVLGMAGLGKTTLAKLVYDDVKWEFDVRAWINLSRSFNTEGYLRETIYQLFDEVKKPVPQEIESCSSFQLIEMVKEFLKRRRYFIVLDDIWDLKVWYQLKLALPHSDCGSRVMLTTRSSDLASTVCADFEGEVYRMNPLSAEESMELFCKKTFHMNPFPEHLSEISERILEKCEGLPLAIVAMSGLLATKSTRVDEWYMVHRSLGAEMSRNGRLNYLKTTIALSINDLSYHLKACLMYFSIFPVNYLVERTRLVRLWIAEGFIAGREGVALEEVAESYLHMLINKSLVLVTEKTSDGRVKTCRIHSILHEILILLSKDYYFATMAKDEYMDWPKKVRRLSVQNSLPDVQKSLTDSGLHSLFIFQQLDSLSEPLNLKLSSEVFRLLHVLDLRAAPLKEFPVEVLRLFCLSYLSLRSTKVNSVPSAIKKLKYLETLDLKHSKVQKLPVEILKLQKLRHLLVYHYGSITPDPHIEPRNGFESPSDVGSLQCLQTLSSVEAYRDDNLLIEIGKLSQLRRLGIVKLRKEDGESLCFSIEKMMNLRSLSVSSRDEDEIIDLQHSFQPPQLQRLYLRGRLDNLPVWISSLHMLVKVVLRWSRLRDADFLESLQDLPNLLHLEFMQAYEGETLRFPALGFQNLKFLGLSTLHQLVSVEIERGAMPCLERLIIHRCSSLQEVPSGIEYLTELKQLRFDDMPSDFIPRSSSTGDYVRVKHIPEIQSSSKDIDCHGTSNLTHSKETDSFSEYEYITKMSTEVRPNKI